MDHTQFGGKTVERGGNQGWAAKAPASNANGASNRGHEARTRPLPRQLPKADLDSAASAASAASAPVKK